MTQYPRTEVDRAAEPVPVADLTYTQASRELDEIVAFFEQREVDVDLLVSRLERATSIVDELDRRLRRTRAQVEQLVPRLEAATAPDRADAPDDEESDPLGEDPDDGSPVARRAAGRRAAEADPDADPDADHPGLF